MHLFSQWLAYLQMIGMGISFELLRETFAKLIARWKPMELDRVSLAWAGLAGLGLLLTCPLYACQDEEYVLADSLLQFREFCRSAILKHRLRIKARGSSRRRSPSPKRSELESFAEMLRCFRSVRPPFLVRPSIH